MLHHDRLKSCLNQDVLLWLGRKRSNLLKRVNENNAEHDAEPLCLDKLFEECSVDGNEHISPDEVN